MIMILKHCLIIFCSLNLINTKTVLREDAAGASPADRDPGNDNDDNNDAEGLLLTDSGNNNDVGNDDEELLSRADQGDNNDDGKDDGASFGSLLENLEPHIEKYKNKSFAKEPTPEPKDEIIMSKVEELFDFVLNASCELKKTELHKPEGQDKELWKKKKKQCFRAAGKWLSDLYKKGSKVVTNAAQVVTDKARNDFFADGGAGVVREPKARSAPVQGNLRRIAHVTQRDLKDVFHEYEQWRNYSEAEVAKCHWPLARGGPGYEQMSGGAKPCQQGVAFSTHPLMGPICHGPKMVVTPLKFSKAPKKNKLFNIPAVIIGISEAVKIIDKISLSHVPDAQMARGGHPTIQYFFDKESYDAIIEYRLRSAMNKIEQTSCVRFQSLRAEEDRMGFNSTLIRVTNPYNQRECSHEPTYNTYENIVELVLGLDCLQERDIMHSLLHAVGFNDEVSHPQRDQFVRVLWDNIQPKYRKLFRIQGNENFAGTDRFEYDPLSIMHFHARAYSSNGRPTILPLIPGLTISPSNELSILDKMKLRLLFGHYCNRRRLTELMDSCKMVMKSDKLKLASCQGVKYDNGNDENQAVDEQDAGSGGDNDMMKENAEDKPLDDNASS